MAHRGLTFGIFLAPFHRLGENPTLSMERDVELLQWLDHLGYDEAWIGEHHSAGWETIASPELIIVPPAEKTKYIKLGSGVTSLPYHHPFMVAQRWVQLDHMTRGRAMLGSGPGASICPRIFPFAKSTLRMVGFENIVDTHSAPPVTFTANGRPRLDHSPRYFPSRSKRWTREFSRSAT